LVENKIKTFLRGLFKYLRIRYPLFIHIPTALLAFVLVRNFDQVLIFFVCISLAFGHFFINSINDLYDLDTDSVHPVKKIENPITNDELTTKQGKILTLSFLIIALLLAIPTNIIWFIMILICLFLGWSYSMKPFRTRAKPLGFFFNESIGASIQFVFAYLTASFHIGPTFPWWVGAFCLFVLGSNGIMVCKDIPDIDSDRQAGMRNFTVAYGIEATRRFVVVMALLALVSSLVITVTHIVSVVGLTLIIMGTMVALATMMKPAERLRDRHTVYQRLGPAAILYSMGILIGAIMTLIIPW